MVDLSAFAQFRLFDFDEIADLRLCANLGSGTQSRIGADLGTLGDGCALDVREGVDDHIISHRHARPEYNIGLDHDIAAQFSVMREEHGFRRYQRHAIAHRLAAPPVLPGSLDHGLLRPAVHASHFPGLGFDDGTLSAGQHDDVGQIIFACRIVVADLVEQDKKVGRSHSHKSGVAQRHGSFGRVGILIFDHLVDDALPTDDDPPIGARVLRPEAQHHGAQVITQVQTVQHGPHGLCPHQRHIAIEDQYVTSETGKRVMRLGNSMASSQLLLLHGDHRACSGDSGFHLLAARANHDDLPLGLKLRDAGQQVQQHWPTRDRMEHLMLGGLHARALPGGKDDDGEWAGGGHGGTRPL